MRGLMGKDVGVAAVLLSMNAALWWVRPATGIVDVIAFAVLLLGPLYTWARFYRTRGRP